jgi:hypothetical protein
MDEFLKMDVFFAVTTVAVIVITVLVAIVLVRLFRILGKVEEISLMLSDEGRELRADLAHVRAELAQKGLILGAVAALGRAFGKRTKKRGDDSP